MIKKWNRQNIENNQQFDLSNLQNSLNLSKFYLKSGRSEELTNLHNKICEGKNVPIVIYGIAGVGKTQFILAYIQQNGLCYDKVLWIDGKSIESMMQSLRNSSYLIEYIDDSLSFENNIQNAYKSLSDKTLLIFDGIPNRKALNDILPDEKTLKSVTCLITSNNCDIIEWADMENMHLDVFSMKDAESFINNRLDNEKSSCIKNLSKRMGCYPLALDQAISYIVSERISINEFLESIDMKSNIQLNNRLSVDNSNYDKSANEISKDIIEKQRDDINIFKMISILCYLDPSEISIVLLYEIELNEDVREILEKLSKYSILSISEDCIKVNEFFQKKFIKNFEENSTHIELIDAVNLFFKHLYDQTDESDSGVLLARDLIPHVTYFSEYLEKLCLLNTYANYKMIKFEYLEKSYKILNWLYYYIKEYEKRKILLLKYITLMKEKNRDPDSRSIEVARLLYYLAFTQHVLYEHKTADDLYGKALAVFEEKLGKDHVDTADLLRNWADNKRTVEKFYEADLLNERVRKIYETDPEENQSNMAILLSEMARSKSKQQKCEEADELFEKALQMTDQCFGKKDHIQYMQILNQYARHNYRNGDHQKAYEKFSRCLPTYERAYGFDHKSSKNIRFYLNEIKRCEDVSKIPRPMSIQETQMNEQRQQLQSTLENLRPWLNKIERMLNNNKIGSSIESVEKASKQNEQINLEIDRKKCEFDDFKNLYRSTSIGSDEFSENIESIIDRYERLLKTKSDHCHSIEEAKIILNHKIDVDKEIDQLQCDFFKMNHIVGLMNHGDIDLIQNHMDTLEDAITKRNIEFELKYLSEKVLSTDIEIVTFIKGIEDSRKKYLNLIDNLNKRKEKTSELKLTMENKLILDEIMSWSNSTSKILEKAEYAENNNSIQFNEHILNILETELHEKIQNVQRISYDCDQQPKINDLKKIQKKLDHFQSLISKSKRRLQTKNEFSNFRKDCIDFEKWIDSKIVIVSSTDCATIAKNTDKHIKSFNKTKQEINEKKMKFEKLIKRGNEISKENISDKGNAIQIIDRLTELWKNLQRLTRSRENDLNSAKEFYLFFERIDLVVTKFLNYYSEILSDIFETPLDLNTIEKLINKYENLEKEKVIIEREIEDLKTNADRIIERFPSINKKVIKLVESSIHPFQNMINDIPKKKYELGFVRKYFKDCYDYYSWIVETKNKISEKELPVNIEETEMIIKAHDEIKIEIDKMKENRDELYSIGKSLTGDLRFLSEGIYNNMISVINYYDSIKMTWKKRDEIYKSYRTIFMIQNKKSFSSNFDEKFIASSEFKEAIRILKNSDCDETNSLFIEAINKMFSDLQVKEKKIDDQVKNSIENDKNSMLSIIKALVDILGLQLNRIKKITNESIKIIGEEVKSTTKDIAEKANINITNNLNNDQDNNNQAVTTQSSMIFVNTLMTAAILFILIFYVCTENKH